MTNATKKRNKENKLNVLITGASNGIGKEVADIFLENNHFVIGLDIVEGENKENLVSSKVDICDKNLLNNVKQYLINNNINLDLIINIAGIHSMASLVETNFDVIKRLIDIDLIGTMNVNHTFHQFLKENGKVIILTSEVASFDPMPFNGLYNIAKSALEVYAQALRQELNLLNQQVVTFQPGSIKTKLSDGSLDATKRFADETILYKKQAHKFYGIVKKFIGKPYQPEKLAKKIYKVCLKRRCRYTYKTHRSAGLVLLNMLPKRMQCFIIKRLLKP